MAAIAGVALPGCGDGASSSGLDVAVTALEAPSEASAGSSFELSATVTNRGSVPASPAVAFVLAATPEVTAEDTLLDLSIPRLVFEPGESLVATTTVSLPENLASGQLYIGAVAPPLDEEVTPQDNARSHALLVSGTDCEPDGLEPDDGPDAATALSLLVPQRHNFCDDAQDWSRLSVEAGETRTFVVKDTEDNADVVLLVRDAAGNVLFNSLGSSASMPRWTAEESGEYYLVATTSGGLFDTGPLTGYTLIVGDVRPDFIVEYASLAPQSSNAGDVLTVRATIDATDAQDVASVDMSVFLSADATVDTGDTLLETASLSAPFADGAPMELEVPLPADLAPGSYHVGLLVDPSDAIAELDETNNASEALPLTVEPLSCTPDSHEEDDFAAQATDLAFDARQQHNLCDDRRDWLRFVAEAGADHRFYLEAPDIYTSSPLNVDVFDQAGAQVGPTETTSFSWLAPAAGTYWLRITEDRYSDIRGTDEPYAVTLLRPLPDLVATEVDPWAGLYSGGQAAVDVAYANAGGEGATAFRSVLVLSPDPDITLADQILGDSTNGSVGWRFDHQRTGGLQFTAQLDASVTPGEYYLGYWIDPDNDVTEIDETNNLIVVPVTVQ